MASIDEIFKSSGISSKRKLEQPVRDPNEIYKSSKLKASDSENVPAEDGSPVEGEDDEDFGPDLPPEDGDDDEGRFFGGGISSKEAQILDYVDEADAAGNRVPQKWDAGWLRKTALSFEKRISKNAELRAKFEDEPHKFISSEADLDAEIKGLSILSEHPELYAEFVRLGSAGSLAGLLAHENTDIAIDAIEIIGELTDEDATAADEQWDVLVDALLEHDLLGLLVSNLSRLDEDGGDESDRDGIYHSLGVLENLCSRGPVAARLGAHEELLRWLLRRIQRSEAAPTQNKQYAAEILALLAQSAGETRRRLAQLDAVDAMLQLVAPYRRRDPERASDEEEYMENLFEALTCLVDEPAGKAKFLDAEGVELCLLVIKEGKMARASALRLLDHAAAGDADVCRRLVEAGGLKTTFTLFGRTADKRLADHLLAVFASMLRLLPADSAERIRLLAKFVEKDYDKIARLVRLRRDHSARVATAEDEFKSQGGGGGDEVELLSRRLDAGLFSLQLVDVILAWLVAEDAGAKRRIALLLAETDHDLGAIKTTLAEQLAGLDTTEQDSRDLVDMLATLLEFL